MTMHYRYLIIDDEKLARTGTLAKLSSMEDTITCVGQAADGEEGLRLTEELKPDIVITDMKMPVMDGGQLLSVLARRFPNIQIIVISGYRDFEYSRQAIARMESQSDMENKLQSSEEYRESLQLNHDREQLRNLICGYAKGSLQLSSRKLAFINRSSSNRLILLHSDHPLPEEDINLLLVNQGYDTRALYLSHPHVENLGFLLLFFTAHRISPSTDTACLRVIDNLKTLFLSRNEQVLFGISGEHESLSCLRDTLQESIQALNQKKIRESRDVFTYRPGAAAPSVLLWPRTDELLFRIESGMTEEANDLVTELFDWYGSLPDATLYDIKYSCFQITGQLKLILHRYIRQLQPDTVDSSIQNILDTMFSLKALEGYYRQFFSSVSQSLAPHHIYADSDIIANVATYIDRNYFRSISVEFVASLFHMNRSYLSHIFKQKQGKSFIDYLNLVRVT
ncbi:MAG TPA: hypothetical protein DF613_12000, partial [Lachnospiraceae bacterium]|nr:hypothetical protein [Lachnospiraceae bacterium]